MKEPIIFGHRGASAIEPENTILAFQRAIDDGAQGFEFDIRMTKDRKIIVLHDATINRTSNGVGSTSNLTYKELLKFDFGKGEKIPLLKTVLEKFGNNYWLNIEVKEEGFENELVDLLRKNNITEKYIISSFSIAILASLAKIDRSLPLALLYLKNHGDLQKHKENLGINSIHPYKFSVNKRLMGKAERFNLKVRVWTVNSVRIANKLVKLGVDGIITNDPKKIIEGMKIKK